VLLFIGTASDVENIVFKLALPKCPSSCSRFMERQLKRRDIK